MAEVKGARRDRPPATTRRQRAAAPPPRATRDGWAPVLLGGCYLAIAYAVFAPSLAGPFVSDDLQYIVSNPHVQSLSTTKLLAFFDPFGEPARHTLNYAPVHLLWISLQWSLWGDSVSGYHASNIVLHALVSLGLAMLWRARGLPLVAAAGLGALFAVHPANAETVAWSFQSKTLLSLGLAVAALLAHPRRPGLALGLFAAALLAKASALFALPVAAVFAWNAWPAGGPERARARWLAAWALVLALYALPQFWAFERLGLAGGVYEGDVFAQLRSMGAIGARYLAMAASGYGVSTFHDPGVVRSFSDPWWLASIALGLGLVARLVWALARRREEAAWWVWAAAAWLPISQLFPFLIPMADHYLYVILPGLVGGVAFAARPRVERWPQAAQASVAVVLVMACGWFAVQSRARAALWASPKALVADSVAHYPDGMLARLARSRELGRRGDAAGAADALRAAMERGYDRFMDVARNAAYRPVRDAPEFEAALRAVAGRWLDNTRDKPDPTQAELEMRAHAHILRDEPALALDALAQASELGEIRSRSLRDYRAARRAAGELPLPARAREEIR